MKLKVAFFFDINEIEVFCKNEVFDLTKYKNLNINFIHKKILDANLKKYSFNENEPLSRYRGVLYKQKNSLTVYRNNISDNWITNAMGNNIKKAEDVRSILNYTLKEKEEVDIEQFVETSIDDEALKVSFKELMEERGIETNFNIDKKWVEKKLKKRSIKTDNGFDIKGNLVDFEDPMKYSVRQNEDGTVDIVIKNVSFFEEK